jgi:hypothetical protein
MLGACAAPAYVKAGILMPVRKVWTPPPSLVWEDVTVTIAQYSQLYEDSDQSAAMRVWADNIMGEVDYRAWQRLKNLEMRRLMDNLPPKKGDVLVFRRPLPYTWAKP